MSLGDINIWTLFSRLGVGCKADDLTLKKNILLRNSRRRNQAEYSKESLGSKRAVLPMMMNFIRIPFAKNFTIIYLIVQNVTRNL
jgi:hypothetical protein